MNEKLHSFPFTDDPVFDIRLCGTSYCDGSYRIDRKRSQVHNFEYIISGGGTVVTPQGTFHPLAGDLYFLPAGEDHLYYSDAEEPWVKIWFNVTGGLAETLARQYGVADTRLFRGCPAEALFEEFIATVDGGADAETVKRRCAVVMHRVIQLMADSAKDGGCSEDAAALRDYIDQSYAGKIRIEDLSALIYRSPSQTIRIFKKNFGVTPYEYALTRKMHAAKELLKNTRLPISGVAAALGFANEHYFSSCFKKQVGTTPGKYRKK